jgi:hypothetical protein
MDANIPTTHDLIELDKKVMPLKVVPTRGRIFT